MRRLVYAFAITLLISISPSASDLTVNGAWIVNRDLTRMPAAEDANGNHPPGGRGGGRRGGGGFGGHGGGIPGLGGGGNGGPNEDELHKLEVIRRRMTEVPDRLIFTRSTDQVTITDGIGRSYSLNTDGKKQQRVTGDGEFKSKTHFEGAQLIVEEDFGGPKLTTTYTPILEGGEIPRLVVTLKPENLPGAARERLERRAEEAGRPGQREVKRVYDVDGK